VWGIGKLRNLLDQDEIYAGLLSNFFEHSQNNHISWLHDIALRRFSQVSQALLIESGKAQRLAAKRVNGVFPCTPLLFLILMFLG
jgi:hypothetical protein